MSRSAISSLLASLDLDSPDMRDEVYALLDDQTASWFPKAPEGAVVSDCATTAHLGAHVAILQRGHTTRLDREGRDYWIKPLREVGAIEPVYLDPISRLFVAGHPVAKSPNNGYRLNAEFVEILASTPDKRDALLAQWVDEDEVRARRSFQAVVRREGGRQARTRHADLIALCREYYCPRFLPEYEVLFTDSGDGDRISGQEEATLRRAGVRLELGDAMPDLLLWSRKVDRLWVIEAVTSDGEVDVHKFRQLTGLAHRSLKAGGIAFTTAYSDWRTAASRQGRLKNLVPNTYVWIADDPSKQFKVEPYSHRAAP